MITRGQKWYGAAFTVLFGLYAYYAIYQDNGEWDLSLWFTIGIVGLQLFSWSIFRHKNMVSYALSFLPAIDLLMFFTHSMNFWYVVGFLALEIGLIVLCSLDWPKTRTTTYSWLGAAALMFLAAATPALVML